MALSANGVVRHGDLELWAEGGHINILDTRNGTVSTESIREMLLRANALNAMGRSLRDDAERRWFRNEIVTKVEDIVQLCRIAKEQRAEIQGKTRKTQVLTPGRDF